MLPSNFLIIHKQLDGKYECNIHLKQKGEKSD